MASTRSGKHALASYEWIKEERNQANEETLRHIEDFSYSVTHELEWLNEKMAEVFNGDPKTLTDIFKTPGRLRNKTPRTAKKANALTPRVPLGDVFASHNSQATPLVPHSVRPMDTMPSFKIAEDSENHEHVAKTVSRSKSPQRVGKPGNTDSGYHGLTEDETDAECSQAVAAVAKQDPSKRHTEETAQTSEASFTSAHESQEARKLVKPAEAIPAPIDEQPVIDDASEDDTSDRDVEEKMVINRKSSFNFSSLPARQPFLGKKSLGPFPGTVESTQAVGNGQAAQKSTDRMEAIQAEQPKTTTQLLHERITMLGQPKAARPSKSIHYPELPVAQSTREEEPTAAVPTSPARPISMISTTSAQDNVTPSGSIKKQYDGPLSASKNRLMSVFKSARSIFASSASTSAAAKLEAHTSPARPSPTREFSHESSILEMPGALRSDASLARTMSRPLSVVSTSLSRKTRNSSESERPREKDLKAQRKAAEELERAREKERLKVAQEQEERVKLERAEAARVEKEALMQAKASEAAKSAAATTGKLKSVGRVVRPAVAPKMPVSVNVKTASQAQSDAVPRPASAMRPSSAHSSVKASSLTTKASTRALEAAARKKEMEEKDKLRRAQQKKELERKRAVKQAEEERKAAEAQRAAQEAKLAAQKQAAEDAKRREQQRVEQQRIEAQRQQEEHERQRAAQELADAIARERAQQQAQMQREATGTIRQLGQKIVDAGIRAVQPNPAKPAKRPHNAEDEPVIRTGPYQQNEGKRRKTDEVEENPRASVMAPPMRTSAMRKETMTRFPMGYTQAPTHPPTMLFKTSQHHVQAVQRPVHPNQTVQMSNARIAFAEGSSKPTTAMPSAHTETHGKFKTPVRVVQTNAKSAAKSSPMYPNGDNIALPEINTDSEEDDDDDEDTGFRAPSWVTSPALRDLLTQQQLVDPETVFGPIAELRMEEVFKNNKNPERLKKFRDRGSSAAWVQNGDAVTSAEKRRDMELRERVAREGGWRYEPGL